ncbi:hypothetical protein [Streptococcus pantholopis]|uniref:Uncharacterized protein n=1 Tax=Streptococcus pantholopis TaxID=1811193 RepID=A0A172Q8P3_9STRE|nr:hypothetical protein [Streptococcus pantholopis]AND79765.1 hypothetical protein A0O21_06860 [Streptococcus pantholopis]
MENKIENLVDNGLESISASLRFLNLILGILLVIITGIYLLFLGKKEKKDRRLTALICLLVGCLAVLSAVFQVANQ